MTDKDTVIASQEAQILRLQQGFDDLKNFMKSSLADTKYCKDYFDKGWNCAMNEVIKRVDLITGASND